MSPIDSTPVDYSSQNAGQACARLAAASSLELADESGHVAHFAIGLNSLSGTSEPIDITTFGQRWRAFAQGRTEMWISIEDPERCFVSPEQVPHLGLLARLVFGNVARRVAIVEVAKRQDAHAVRVHVVSPYRFP